MNAPALSASFGYRMADVDYIDEQHVDEHEAEIEKWKAMVRVLEADKLESELEGAGLAQAVIQCSTLAQAQKAARVFLGLETNF